MSNSAKKILCTLALGCFYCPTYSHAKTASNQDQAKQSAKQTSPIIVYAISPQKSDQEAADDKAKAQHDDAIKSRELLLTAVIAAAAIIQAGVAFFQWLIYRQQLRTSMPLVVVDWDNLVHISPLDPSQVIPNGMTHHFRWGMRNTGDTPAFVTEVSVRFVSVPTSQGAAAMEYAPPKPYTGEPLFTESKPFAGGLTQYTSIDDTRGFEDIESVYRSGKETLFAFGYINFSDRYGKSHTSSFCFKYFAWKTFRSDYDGFGIAKDKKNRYT